MFSWIRLDDVVGAVDHLDAGARIIRTQAEPVLKSRWGTRPGLLPVALGQAPLGWVP